jgi:signal transduction histidine kinase
MLSSCSPLGHRRRGMRETAQPALLRYGIAVVASTLAALVTEGLQPLLTPGRFLFFLMAVVVSAWYGGFRAGLLATTLGALGHAFLLLPVSFPPRAADRGGWLGLGLFIPAALLVSWLIEALHAARREAQFLAKALRERVTALAETGRRKDEFLAVLGHELRNPLAPISAALQVLRLRDDAPTSRWARGVVERQVNHLSRLVDDLLDSSRVARGKVLLHRDRLDLVRFVRDTLEDYTTEREAAGLALQRELPEGAAWVEADPTRLAQVLGNLLHNAAKFTDRGGRVTVRLALEPDRQRAVVAVRDSGIGMEPTLLPRVFETYTQGERGRGRGGLGLGLALVKDLVELHGGEVRAASAGPGRGAEFSFWIPLAREPAAVTPKPPATCT